MPYRTVAPIGGNLGAMTRMTDTLFLVQQRSNGTVLAWDCEDDTVGVWATYTGYDASSHPLSAPSEDGTVRTLGTVHISPTNPDLRFFRVVQIKNGLVEYLDSVPVFQEDWQEFLAMGGIPTLPDANFPWRYIISWTGGPDGLIAKFFDGGFNPNIPNPGPIRRNAGSTLRFGSIGVTDTDHSDGTGKLIYFGENYQPRNSGASGAQHILEHALVDDTVFIGEPFNVTALSPRPVAPSSPNTYYLAGLAPGAAGFPRLVEFGMQFNNATNRYRLNNRIEPGGDLFGLTTPITGCASTPGDGNPQAGLPTGGRYFFTIGDGFIYEAIDDQVLSWWELAWIIWSHAEVVYPVDF